MVLYLGNVVGCDTEYAFVVLVALMVSVLVLVGK